MYYNYKTLIYKFSYEFRKKFKYKLLKIWVESLIVISLVNLCEINYQKIGSYQNFVIILSKMFTSTITY